MIPTHGAATSAFLLANSARLGRYGDLETWIRAAGDRSGFLSGAIDHEPIARLLLQSGLVSDAGEFRPGPRISSVSERADRPSLVALALLLLEADPPPWLAIAVTGAEVHHEVIPSSDLLGLQWLFPELDGLLIAAQSAHGGDEDLRALGVGCAAEMVVFAALQHANRVPTHLALISDRYGYDIESSVPSTARWEVKGATQNTRRSFHLTRNEYAVSRQYGSQWRIIQVEFDNSCLTAESITAEHVKGLRELSADHISTLVPEDRDEFYWEVSSLVQPATSDWQPSELEVPATLRLEGLETLGRRTQSARTDASPAPSTHS